MKAETKRELPGEVPESLIVRAARGRPGLGRVYESAEAQAARVELEIRESEALRVKLKGFLNVQETGMAKREGLA